MHANGATLAHRRNNSEFEYINLIYCTYRSHIFDEIHTEKSFRNLIQSNQNQIIFTIFSLIRNQTDVRLVPNQPKNGKYNLISG